MDTKSLSPAAQYIRMSTEGQQYSLENQMAANERYAKHAGLVIVKTYSDAAKSGVMLRRRAGLRQLLQDVVTGIATYKHILVYDVSRWGRFQDSDEAAHYEFLCKSAGVPVHYCAEPFRNDGSIPSSILKALKRTMAAEYSRELGAKVLEGQRRLARLGFKQGGMPGYGLRRMLVDSSGRPKQLLGSGERKSIATDRVKLVMGPTEEIEIVRAIYRMFVFEGRTVYWIANDLNRRGVPYTVGERWNYTAVYNILTHPKYIGCHVFGRSTQRLYTPSVRQPESNWTVTPGAFDAIVDEDTFSLAQRRIKARVVNRSNERLLEDLRQLLAKEGKLTLGVIQNSPNVASPSTYRDRFGSLREAYQRIGYGVPEQFGFTDVRRRTQTLRDKLVSEIQALFPHDISIVRRGNRFRPSLVVRDRLQVAVLVARSIRTWKTALRWCIDPVSSEGHLTTLLARLNDGNDAFLDLHILSRIERRSRFLIRLDDPILDSSEHIVSLTEFVDAVERAGRQGKET